MEYLNDPEIMQQRQKDGKFWFSAKIYKALDTCIYLVSTMKIKITLHKGVFLNDFITVKDACKILFER